MRSWTLRRQLVVAVVGLLALVSLGIGAVSVLAVQTTLTNRLDSQLQAATARLDNDDSTGVSDRPNPPLGDILDSPGQSVGTLFALTLDGSVIGSGYRDADNEPQGLTADQEAVLADLPQSREPVTVDLGGDLGAYRVIVSPELEDLGVSVVTGLPLSSLQADVGQLLWIILAVAVVGLLAAAAVGTAVVRAALRPLQRVAATATSVAEMRLDRGEVDLKARVPERDTNPKTEVGSVGGALNRLLESVSTALAARQASEDKVRHFVADASHELRTPLASIRGYAELSSRQADRLPEDVAHGLERIGAESVRMTSLVEDLLLLARLDSHRELEKEEVDVTRLVLETTGDAHAAAPDHRWLVELPEEPVSVIGDDQRLRQVLVNLLANARMHTPAGTNVTTALSAAEDGVVRLTITDDGPGIDPELQENLFERFVRGDSSRSRGAGTGGSGLGLSIVRGVIAAHEGTAAVHSVPGETVFTVTLPAA